MGEPRRPLLVPSPQQLRLLAEEVVLGLPAVEQYLNVVVQAAALQLGLSCGITYQGQYGAITVASSDALASTADELQYGADDGPCLRALRTGEQVWVEDLTTDLRWPGYSEHALRAGVGSSLSCPLIVTGVSVGALNAYSTVAGAWPADQMAAVVLAGIQVGGVLHAVHGMASDVIDDPKLSQDLLARHRLDIATGMLMARLGCDAAEAHAVLDREAADNAEPLGDVVARMITSYPPSDG